MNCFPSCEVFLPKTGKAYISSKLNICKSPAVLTFSITSDGKRSVSSFAAGNHLQYRTIGNEYWPMQLQVKFKENADEGGYYADACIQTVRTGNTTCFMGGFIDGSADTGCKNHAAHNDSGFPIIILYVILAICLLLLFVAVITLLYRRYTSRKENNRESRYCSQKTENIFAENEFLPYQHFNGNVTENPLEELTEDPETNPAQIIHFGDVDCKS